MFGLVLGMLAALSSTVRCARVLTDAGEPEMAPMMAMAPMAMAPMAEASVAQQYEQCGGTFHSGPTTCATGLSCEYQNDYYSQCTRDDSAPEIAQQYEQCGGEEPFYEGPMTCTTNLECIRFSTYYAQCLMDAPEPAMAPMPAMAPEMA